MPTHVSPDLSPDVAASLAPTATVDSDHPDVQAFAAAHRANSSDPVEQAVALYYAVRDGVRYDPYTCVLTPEALRASTTLTSRRAWCVPKAVLLAAVCRASGIPARLGFADVRNHISTERMRQTLKSDVYAWHGYTSIWLNGKWVKATPAFNIELCEKFRILPLNFNGREDSIYHPFDMEGHKHMEYLRFRGEFDDVPIDAIAATFREMYGDFGGMSENTSTSTSLTANWEHDLSTVE